MCGRWTGGNILKRGTVTEAGRNGNGKVPKTKHLLYMAVFIFMKGFTNCKEFYGTIKKKELYFLIQFDYYFLDDEFDNVLFYVYFNSDFVIFSVGI